MEKTKIVYVYPALNTVGGADRVISEKANYFADICNYDVYIVTTQQNGTPLYFPLSPKVKHIDLGVNFLEQYNHCLPIRACIYFLYLRRYKKRLSNFLCKLKPHFTISTISRDIDFLYSIKDGSLKIAEAHVAKPYIRNIHRLKSSGSIYKLIAWHWTNRLEKAIRKFDCLVVLTQRDADSWKGVKEAIVIPNSLPFYPQNSSTCDNKQIISIGRYDEQKGYDMLVEAWSIVHNKHKDWSITIYGNGELKDSLIEKASKYNLGNSFILHEPVKDIENKYLENSIYVMSSRFEGFGMVLAEAMACGLPCVSFDCKYGPSDIIKDGKDGILVENSNIAELAQKINYLIENPIIRKEMGKLAKQNIIRYSRENIMQLWCNLFEKLKENRNCNLK